MHRPRLRLAAVLVVMLVAAASGCSDDDTAKTDTTGATSGKKAAVSALEAAWDPEELTVEPGTTVTWTNISRVEHNILRDEGNTIGGKPFGIDEESFDNGDEYSFTFDEPGTYHYYCSLHGTKTKGMTGTITVSAEPVEATTTTSGTSGTVEEGAGEIRRVPQDFDTIQAGVDAAEPGDMVFVDEGTYNEAVTVTTPNIVIRGADRSRTILDGEFELDNGILVVETDGVAIENMTAMNYKVNGFFWTGVEGYRGSYLTAVRNGDYGIYAFDSRYGQFDHSYGSGSPDAGFYIGQCNPCDALIVDSEAAYNGLGYSGTNASTNLVIARSSFHDNRAGIVPNSGSYEKLAPEESNTIVGNLVYRNSNMDTPAIDAALLVFGSGIVSAGGRDNVIERNRIWDHDVAGILLADFPEGDKRWDASGNTIRGNHISDSGKADIMIASNENRGNCVAENTFETSAPRNVETAAPCEGEPTSEFTDGLMGLVEWLGDPGAEKGDFTTMPDAPEGLPSMPDAASAPWTSADKGNLPTIEIDPAAIELPDAPDDAGVTSTTAD